MAEHNQLGNEGEEQAREYLIKKGYKIRHFNWRFKNLELDIVAEKDDFLIVVEVKTRSTDTFEHPQETITNRKIKNIVQAAEEYIFRFDWQGETRFDVISVIPRGKDYVIEHVEDAFFSPIG